MIPCSRRLIPCFISYTYPLDIIQYVFTCHNIYYVMGAAAVHILDIIYLIFIGPRIAGPIYGSESLSLTLTFADSDSDSLTVGLIYKQCM